MKVKAINCSEYQTLKKYERQFLTATKANYVSALKTKDAEALFAIYNRITGRRERVTSCPKCVLRVVKLLSGAYDVYTAKLAKKQAEKEAENLSSNDKTDILEEKEELKNAEENNKDNG